MNPDTGYIHFGLSTDQVTERLVGGRPLVAVPEEQLETVVNMTRQQRRAWARREAKRLLAEARP